MKKLASHLLLGAALLATTIAFPETGRANQIQFILTDCNTSSGCSPQTGNNFGTVTITNGVAGVVSVDVDLASNYTWANTGLISFAFNLGATFTGANTPTLSGVTATNWTPTLGAPATGFNSDGMGSAQYGLNFGGANNSVTANLDFTLTATGLDVTDFTKGGTANDTGIKYYFLTDICTRASGNCSSGTGSSTGLVGAGVPVPVPVPVPIVGAGLPGLLAASAGLVAFARRRRSRFA
jgi:hypothetical protein